MPFEFSFLVSNLRDCEECKARIKMSREIKIKLIMDAMSCEKERTERKIQDIGHANSIYYLESRFDLSRTAFHRRINGSPSQGIENSESISTSVPNRRAEFSKTNLREVPLNTISEKFYCFFNERINLTKANQSVFAHSIKNEK